MDMTSAGPSEYEELSRILAEVFSADPVLSGLLAPGDDPLTTWAAYFRIEMEECYGPYGRIDVACEGGEVLGVALWLAPDAVLPAFANARRMARLARAMGRTFLRAQRHERAWEKFHPVYPHWYLAYIAVTAAARGRGVGSLLIDRGIEAAGKHAMYLESTTRRSRVLYERKGFVPLGMLSEGTQLEMTGMWRPGVIG